MMRKSGVSPAVKRLKLSSLMPRRAASGHMPATQRSKLPAASRIADAVIRGWPDAPSSPLQGALPDGTGSVAGSVFGPEKMPPNRLDNPPPEDCASARSAHSKRAATMVAATSAFAKALIGSLMSPPLAAEFRLSGGPASVARAVSKSLTKLQIFHQGQRLRLCCGAQNGYQHERLPLSRSLP